MTVIDLKAHGLENFDGDKLREEVLSFVQKTLDAHEKAYDAWQRDMVKTIGRIEAASELTFRCPVCGGTGEYAIPIPSAIPMVCYACEGQKTISLTRLFECAFGVTNPVLQAQQRFPAKNASELSELLQSHLIKGTISESNMTALMDRVDRAFATENLISDLYTILEFDGQIDGIAEIYDRYAHLKDIYLTESNNLWPFSIRLGRELAYERLIGDLDRLDQNEYETAYLCAAGKQSLDKTVEQLGYPVERVNALVAECKADIAEEQKNRANQEPSTNEGEEDIPY